MDYEAARGLLAGMRVPAKMIDFGHALDDACVLADGWAYFLEKPWKWADEYIAWDRCGCPQKGDPTWVAFMDALDTVAT